MTYLDPSRPPFRADRVGSLLRPPERSGVAAEGGDPSIRRFAATQGEGAFLYPHPE